MITNHRNYGTLWKGTVIHLSNSILHEEIKRRVNLNHKRPFTVFWREKSFILALCEMLADLKKRINVTIFLSHMYVLTKFVNGSVFSICTFCKKKILNIHTVDDKLLLQITERYSKPAFSIKISKSSTYQSM